MEVKRKIQRRNMTLVEDRAQFVILYDFGLSQRELGSKFKISRSTIQSILRKWKEKRTVQILPRSGRPRKIMARTQRYIEHLVRTDHRITADIIAERLELNVSSMTIYRAIKASGEFASYWSRS